MEEALEKLERDFKSLRLEWTAAYDKLLTIAQRISKRAEVVERLQAVSEEEGESRGPRPVLSREEQLQEEILARRRRIVGTNQGA